jgi:microcin C transport system permease protein
VARLNGTSVEATARFGGNAVGDTLGSNKPLQHSATITTSRYPGAQGIDPELIKELEQQFGFDQPLHMRFFKMVGNYLRFDFGKSYYRDESVWHLVISKLPVSISLGLWMTLIVYGISIPLGIKKAVRDGSKFDVTTSTIITMAYSIPAFVYAVLLIVVFAGGRYFSLFPLRGLTSDNWADMTTLQQITDYFWHIALPVAAMTIGSFANLTMLTKNSFMDEISKQYVLTARSKGLSENRVLYGHVFRNAMLIVIAGFPHLFISVFFTGAFLIETIFSLDGLGLLGFESVINRDYPVMFGTLYVFSLITLVVNLIGDVVYSLVDPRIDFETRDG